MNENSGTFDWSMGKIWAYAAAFREGDAVKINGEWHEVEKYKNTHSTSTTSIVTDEVNPRTLNYDPDGKECYEGFTKGFLGSHVDSPYEITTPKDYEVQEGDKLVWLGKTQEYYGRSELTFGRVYDVQKDGDRLIYKTDDTLSILARSEKDRWKFWGVIPKWKNVKGSRFSTGDMVRVIEDSSLDKFDRDYIGKIGVIMDVDNTSPNLPYAIKFDSRINLVWFGGCALELAEKKKGKEHKQEKELGVKVECNEKYKVGDIVEVVNEEDKHFIGQSGVIMYVDCYDDKLPYDVEFSEDSAWFNSTSLRKVGESLITNIPKIKHIIKIKTIQGDVGHWKSFDERVNAFMQDKDVVDVSHSIATDIEGFENIIAVITYRCSKV